jgi:heme-degrading monooxygenase HmoA
VTGVQVVLYHRTEDGRAALEAYHESSRRMQGTPGLLGDEFLQAVDDDGRFTVVSRWESLESFVEWESSAAHKEQTAPLRPYRDLSLERPFEVYRVAARYGRATGPEGAGEPW